MNKLKTYTVSIYTENTIGLLNRISGIFQRRHINILSINSSISEIENVFKWAIVVNITEEQIKKVITQIEKQIEVIKAYYHTDDEILYQESAMFKIKSELLFDNKEVQKKIKDSNVRIIEVNKKYCVLEKSGDSKEVTDLYDFLNPYGILQFVRSGRIVISREPMNISILLEKS